MSTRIEQSCKVDDRRWRVFDRAAIDRLRAEGKALAERMANAEPIGPLVATGNYSYGGRRYGGDGYILVGDAAAFIDPLFSSGVMMAMSGAALGAEVVHAWLNDRKLGKTQMRNYERRVRRGLASLSWLIYRINTPVLRDIFMSSFDLFDTRNGLLAILAGDFYAKLGLFSPLRRLQLSYGCLYFLSMVGVRLQREGLSWRPRLGRTN